MRDYQPTFRNQFGLPEEAKEDDAMDLIAKRIAWVAFGYLAIHLVVYQGNNSSDGDVLKLFKGVIS